MMYLTTLDRERSSQQTRDTTHERANKATGIREEGEPWRILAAPLPPCN